MTRQPLVRFRMVANYLTVAGFLIGDVPIRQPLWHLLKGAPLATGKTPPSVPGVMWELQR